MMGAVTLLLAGALLAGTAGYSGQATEVQGTVTDNVGVALAGVQVEVMIEGEGFPSSTTDEEGAFRVEAPEGSPLRFTKTGFLPVEFIAPAESCGLRISLRNDTSLAVRVLDEDGKPIKGAQAALLEGTKERLDLSDPEGEKAEPLSEGKADAEGNAFLWHMPPGLYWLRVKANGYRDALTQKPLTLRAGKPMSRTLLLKPAVTVSGRILDKEGRPLAGGRVGVLVMRRREPSVVPKGDWGYRVDAWHETDEKSRYRLDLDTESLGVLVATAPGRAPAWRRLRPAKGERSLEIDLTPPMQGEIHGRVVDGSGHGVPGVRVLVRSSLYEEDDLTSKKTQVATLDLFSLIPSVDAEEGLYTDEDGAFNVPGVPAGSHYVQAWREGYLGRSGESVEMDGEGAIAQVTLDWDEGVSLRGTVLDEAGEPVEGARLSLARRSRFVLSDEEGRFQILGLGEKSSLSLFVTADGYGITERREIPLDGTPITVRLHPAGSISGRLFDAHDGQPVQAFAIRFEPLRSGGEVQGVRKDRVFSEREGEFLFTGVPAGAYWMDVHAIGYMRHRVEKVEVRIGEDTPVPPIHLERGREIRGVVLDRTDGTPLQGTWVNVRAAIQGQLWPQPPGGLGNLRHTETDAEGRFRLAGIPVADVLLRAGSQERATARRLIRFDEEETARSVEILLDRGGTVEVTVLDSEGDPLPGKNVRLRWTGEPPARWGALKTSGPDGKAVYERVLPGDCEVYLKGFPERQVIRVEESALASVTLQEAGVLLSGRLLFRGQPIDWRIIHFIRPGTRWKARQKGDGWEVGPLPPGDLMITGFAPWEDPERPGEKLELAVHRKIQVPEGVDRMEVDLVVDDLRISGRVIRDDTEQTIRGASVSAQPADHSRGSRARTDKEGRFELVVGRPGEFKISADAKGGLRMSGDLMVTVPPDESVTGLVLRLSPGGVVRGRITDAYGKPVSMVDVRCYPMSSLAGRETMRLNVMPAWNSPGSFVQRLEDGTATSLYSDSEGNYRRGSLPFGPGLLRLSHPDYAPVWITNLEIGEVETVRDVVLTPGGALEILLPSGWKRSKERFVRLSRPGLPLPLRVMPGSNAYVFEMPTGSYLLPHLPAGTWTVERLDGAATGRAVVEVREGEKTVVDLTDSSGD